MLIKSLKQSKNIYELKRKQFKKYDHFKRVINKTLKMVVSLVENIFSLI
jgi:hypothetical protein